MLVTVPVVASRTDAFGFVWILVGSMESSTKMTEKTLGKDETSETGTQHETSDPRKTCGVTRPAAVGLLPSGSTVEICF